MNRFFFARAPLHALGLGMIAAGAARTWLNARLALNYRPMRMPLLGALLIAPFVLIGSPAFAATTVDISSFWTSTMAYVAAAIGAVISFLVGWLLILLKTKTGLSIDDSMRASLQTAVTNAAGLVLNKLGNVLPGTITIDNAFVAEAVQYVVKAAPDAIAHFGLTPDALATKITAVLPQVANTTTTSATTKSA